MPQRTFSILLLATMLVTALSAQPAIGATYFGFAIGTADAPRPPVLVLRGAPRVVVVPNSRVSRLMETGEVDVFRFGGTWYAYTAGFWYLAGDVHGPFHVIDARYVPRAVLFVPPAWWKHHPESSRLGPGPAGLGSARGARVEIVTASQVAVPVPAATRRHFGAKTSIASKPSAARHAEAAHVATKSRAIEDPVSRQRAAASGKPPGPKDALGTAPGHKPKHAALASVKRAALEKSQRSATVSTPKREEAQQAPERNRHAKQDDARR